MSESLRDTLPHPPLGPVLVTGAAGVIGRPLVLALRRIASEVRPLDSRLSPRQDVRDPDILSELVPGCVGVIHLAALSRVAPCEAAPDLAWSTNTGGTAALTRALLAQPRPPWLLLVSSREVYGDAERLPVHEDAPPRPKNVYARTKLEAERVVAEARRAGLRVAVARLCNVYGAQGDAPDRVIPAFLSAARLGRPLELRGPASSVDLVHIDDVLSGLLRVVRRLQAGEDELPTVHLCGGVETPLRELAERIRALYPTRSPILRRPGAPYEVRRFVGDPTRAARLLGWRATVPLSAGLARLARSLPPLPEPLGALP